MALYSVSQLPSCMGLSKALWRSRPDVIAAVSNVRKWNGGNFEIGCPDPTRALLRL